MKEELALKVRKQLVDPPVTFHDEVSDAVPAFPRKNKKKRKKSRRSEAKAELRADPAYDNPSDEPVRFCSRSEAICAELLRRFVPHFELLEGVTFQVPIGRDSRGNTLAVDFLVDGVLFEYHPVRFFRNKKGCGDFKDHDEYKSYTRVYHALNPEKRDFFHEVMRARLAENYFRKRRAQLDQHPLFRRTELIVATSVEEFYHRVIKRFGKNYPKSAERFAMLFHQLQHSLPD